MLSYSLLKTAHVLCAMLFIGNVIVTGTWAALAERTRNHEIVKFSNRLVLITDAIFTGPGAIGVLITGHLMAGQYAAQPGWIAWSYALFGISGLIWAVVLLPIQLKQRQLLSQSTVITADYLRLSRTWQIVGAFATLFPFPVLYMMVSKAVPN
jgi:uncharacterized membrane protein